MRWKYLCIRPFPEPSPFVCLIRSYNSSTIFIPAKLDSIPVVALFDTGSAITIVFRRTADLLKIRIIELFLPEGITTSGTPSRFSGQITPTLRVADKSVKIQCLVAANNECAADFLVGNDSISKPANDVSISYRNKTISFDKLIVNFVVPDDPKSSNFEAPVFLSTETLFAPLSDNIVQGTLHTIFPNNGNFLSTMTAN